MEAFFLIYLQVLLSEIERERCYDEGQRSEHLLICSVVMRPSYVPTGPSVVPVVQPALPPTTCQVAVLLYQVVMIAMMSAKLVM